MVDFAWETAALAACVQENALIAGMDEVGRGALAGPVCVGLAVINAGCLDAGFPAGLRDSKALTPARREALVPPLREWLYDFAIGEATSDEIDEFGIMSGLRLAGWRALNEVDARGHLPQRLLLDGNHNFLAAPCQPTLFNRFSDLGSGIEIAVETLVKADDKAATVAAASVLAKVYRDSFMRTLPDAGYGWSHNVGYATKEHREAIARLGASRWHRQSWKLV